MAGNIERPMSNENKNQYRIISPKMSVSNFKNMGFRNNFKGAEQHLPRSCGNLDNRST